MDKKNLQKLIDFVLEISEISENKWFKEKLIESLTPENKIDLNSAQIEEIYEYCLNKIINEQSQMFYLDSNLTNINQKLIDDYIRMERFRRGDNFEDFCLALFQQIEGIVNELSTEDLRLMFISSMNQNSHKIWNSKKEEYEEKQLWQLILFPDLNERDKQLKISKNLLEWDFLERYKLILFYYYFNEKIYNFYDFQKYVSTCIELYQSRNLNHRGGKISDKQKTTIEKVKKNSHKYYFKFMGFLEDFTSKINSNTKIINGLKTSTLEKDIKALKEKYNN